MRKNRKDVMFICSVGGHLTQMLQLQDLIREYNYILVTDKTPVTIPLKSKFNVEYMTYCSRKYKFSYIFKEAWNVIKAVWLLIKYNPRVIVTTGTHTAMPTCVIAHFLGKKVIYIESFAKSKSPTKSAKYAHDHNIADTLVVQWESLKKSLPNSEFWGWIY